MIKIYGKIVLASILLTPILYAKDNVKKVVKPTFKTVWEKTYGGSDDDIANAIVMLENGDSALLVCVNQQELLEVIYV